MLGKTHFATGIAVSLLTVRPNSMPLLIAGTATAAIGSVISDIDSGTSDAHQKSNIVLGVCAAAVAAAVAAELIWHVGIYERLHRSTTVWRMLLGAAMFIAICAFGRSRPHRSFMHSITALIMLTACMEVFAPPMSVYFIPAFWTHILLDTLNRRKVKLFWPIKKGVCFKLCSSKGRVNHILFGIGCAGCIIGVLTSPVMITMIQRVIY